jgi:apolipoprotein N-acyltransferase
MAESFWCRLKSIGLRNPWLVAEPRFLARYGFLLMTPLVPCIPLFTLGLPLAFPMLVMLLFSLGLYTAQFEGRFDNGERLLAVALLVFTLLFIVVGIVSDWIHGSFYQNFTVARLSETSVVFVVLAYKIAFLCRVIARCQKRQRNGGVEVSPTEREGMQGAG